MVKKREPATAEDLRRQAEALARAPLIAVEDDADADVLDATEYTFDVHFKDRRGTVYDGVITNRILTVGEQQAAAATAARLAGGVPYEALEPTAAALNQAIAHMALSFTAVDTGEYRCPAWAKDLRALHDQSVILELWGKVVAHERRFFRLDTDPEARS